MEENLHTQMFVLTFYDDPIFIKTYKIKAERSTPWWCWRNTPNSTLYQRTKSVHPLRITDQLTDTTIPTITPVKWSWTMWCTFVINLIVNYCEESSSELCNRKRLLLDWFLKWGIQTKKTLKCESALSSSFRRCSDALSNYIVICLLPTLSQLGQNSNMQPNPDAINFMYLSCYPLHPANVLERGNVSWTQHFVGNKGKLNYFLFPWLETLRTRDKPQKSMFSAWEELLFYLHRMQLVIHAYALCSL